MVLLFLPSQANDKTEATADIIFRPVPRWVYPQRIIHITY